MSFILLGILVNAQDSGDRMFDNSVLHEIKFEFSQTDYWSTLISNYEGNPDPFDTKPYLMGKVTIDGEVVDSIGVRFKGFTSYPFDSDKKPIKIDFNEFVAGKRYDGLRKLNLNNSTGDPSMHRDVICYDMMRSIGVKAPRTSFARVYFNDQYWGLYQVIEQVDQEFLQNNFSNDDGNLFKNLSWSKFEWNGTSPSGYNNIFSLKTNREENDWSGFINLMDVLNNTPDAQFKEEIEKIFNVDLFLKALAVDVASNNWDSYLEHGRNWYIYEDTQTGLFHWIPWDYNFSFGGGFGGGPGGDECEIFIEFVSVRNGTPSIEFFNRSFSLGDITAYRWDFGDGNTSEEENPVHEYDAPGTYEVCLTLEAGPDCEMTDCRIVNTADNLHECSSIVDNTDPPSVGEAFATVVQFAPHCCDEWSDDCEELYGWISNPGGFGSGNFAIDQRDNSGVLIRRLLNEEEYFNRYIDFNCTLVHDQFTSEKYNQMLDNNKALIDQSVQEDPNLLASYNAFLEDIGEEGMKKVIADRIVALMEDLETLSSCSPAPSIALRDVVINEFMASNDSISTLSDAAGEYDDWIEIYNNTTETIDLSDAYLSDDADNLLKWKFPSGTQVISDGYLIVWADRDDDQPGLHCNFKLAKEGDEIFLTNADGSTIDQIEYEEQSTNVSFARTPNGTGDFIAKEPTFKANNDTGEPTSTQDLSKSVTATIYPNPAANKVNITLKGSIDGGHTLDLFSATGVKLQAGIPIHNDHVSLDLEGLNNGFYFIHIINEEGHRMVQKFSKIQ